MAGLDRIICRCKWNIYHAVRLVRVSRSFVISLSMIECKNPNPELIALVKMGLVLDHLV